MQKYIFLTKVELKTEDHKNQASKESQEKLFSEVATNTAALCAACDLLFNPGCVSVLSLYKVKSV